MTILNTNLTSLLLLLCISTDAQKILTVESRSNNKPSGTQSSPYNSINEAIQEANNYWKTADQDVTIIVKPGEYFLDEPIILSHQVLYNKKENVKLTITGQDGAPAIVSGGAKVQGWLHEGDNLYSARWNKEPFRQLYIEGKRAIRAREPNCNYYKLDWDTVNNKVFVPLNGQNFDFKNGKTEIFIQKIWSCQIFRIKNAVNFDGFSELKFLPEDEIVFNTRRYQIKEGTSFHMENNFQFVDADNEWYLDGENGIIYLYKSDVASVNELRTEAPQLEKLLAIQGEEGEKLTNIKISNLIFENTNWTLPDSLGFYAAQASYFYNLRDKQPKNGTVVIENATNIEFSNNTIRNAGGNALMLYHNVNNSKIINNTINDISANGIVVDWYLNKNLDRQSYCNSIEITGNLITRTGKDYFGSTGIVAGYVYDLLIEGNFLYNLPYTGISVGWGHTYDSTSLGNNTVKYNYIGNAMGLMSDGGGIYTLSNQPGTIIESNFIENIVQSKWSIGRNHVYGIYLDEGSNNITVRNNRFANVTKGYVSNSPSGINDVALDQEISLEAFKKVNKLYQNYDSLRSFLFENARCAEYFHKNSISISPNPIRSGFYIVTDFNEGVKTIDYEIFSPDGRKIANGKASMLKDNIFFSRLPVKMKVGVYLLRIFNGYNHYSAKVLVGE